MRIQHHRIMPGTQLCRNKGESAFSKGPGSEFSKGPGSGPVYKVCR